MNLRQYLSILAIGTAVSLSAWCIVVLAIDPTTAGSLAFLVFYISLGAGLSGLFTIFGTMVRVMRHGEEHLSMAVARSFRQAGLLAALLIISLYLMANGLFSISVLLLVIGVLGFIEFIFLLLEDHKRTGEG